jgi:hypothetical protein
MIQKENSFGTFDQEINTFFKDAHHFACLINTCLYQGQEIVKPQDLMLVDPKIQAYTRDVLMLWNGRYGSYYLGIENQLIENYPMPYRILQYDCLVYKDQMDTLEKEHRKKKDLRSSEEFLSGIKEEEKEVIVMCESLYRMREEASNKGFIKGKIQGKTEGIQIGKEDGILMILKNLLKKGISDSYILEITGVSSELLIKAKQSRV